MSAGAPGPQQQQQQQQTQSWTAATYHVGLLAKLVDSVQDEVRRQQDAHDHALEVFEARACGVVEPEGDLGFWLAPSATAEEQTAALHEHVPLGTLHTNALVALGRYKLRQRLQAHLTRLEEERRAVAVAACDGTGGAPLPPPPPPPPRSAATTQPAPVKANTAQGDGEDGNGETAATAPAAASCGRPVKVEREAETSAVGLSQLLSLQAKTELDGDAGSGTDARDRHRPTWRPLRTQEETPTRSDAPHTAWNGAYFVPHAMPAGAPLPRYRSTDTPPSSSCADAASASASPTSSVPAATRLPTLVVPVPVRESRPGQRSGAAPAAPMTRRRDHDADARTGLFHTLWARLDRLGGRLQSHVRFIGTAAHALAAEPLPTAEVEAWAQDRVMQLWWRLWPRHPEASVRASNATPTTGAAPWALSRVLPLHTTVRPTLAMVAALVQLTELNYTRDRARCAALEACMAALPRPGRSGGGGGSVRTASLPPQVRFLFDSGDAGAEAGDDAGGVVTDAQVRQLRQSLARRQAALVTAYEARMALLGELTDALEEETTSPPCVADSPGGGRESGARVRAPGSGVSDKAPPAKRPRREHGAVASHPERPTALEVLRRAVATPHFLLQLEKRRLRSSGWFTADPAAAIEVPPRQEELVEAAHTSALPNGITGVRLPPAEADSTDPAVTAGLWPVELDARIRHELRAVVPQRRRPTPDSTALHVPLSADEVRRLEAAAEAGELSARQPGWVAVATLLSPRVLAHPIEVTQGWLYVHGRGEMIVANVELR